MSKQILAMHKSATQRITASQIKALLAPTKGVTFLGVEYVSKVSGIAAKHKGVDLVKVCKANVMSFNGIKDFELYKHQVQRSAEKFDNDPEKVKNYVVSETYYEHTDCFGVVQHKGNPDQQYLYCIYNSCDTEFYCNGEQITRDEASAYCTPSGAKGLLSTSKVVHNKTNGVTHDLTLRTIAMQSLVSVKGNGQTLSV